MEEKSQCYEKMSPHDQIVNLQKVHNRKCKRENHDEELQNVLDYIKSPPSKTTVKSVEETTKIIDNEKTPHSNRRVVAAERANLKEEIQVVKTADRKTPLPVLKFACSEAVWLNMVYREEATMKMRNPNVFSSRSTYLPRMRAILLDWIMEVCEVYHLRRTTYYLAVDYIDRYLTVRPNVPKTQLQLLGVSCLFIAAKIEEIYPPKLSEFSYVCDGACTEQEILACELLLLNTLTWDVSSMTATMWLSLYMQILCNMDTNKNILGTNEPIDMFQFPQYSAYKFVKASHIIDLFSMDSGFLKFSYSVIAAAAIYYIYGKEAAIKASGLYWDKLKVCVDYMRIFYKILSESKDPRLQSTYPANDVDDLSQNFKFLKNRLPNLIADELHCLQTHVVNLDYFEKSSIMRLEELGLRVEKVYVKEKKSTGKAPKSEENDEHDDDEEEDEYEDVDENEGKEKADEEETTTIVMYQVESALGKLLDQSEDDDEKDDAETHVNVMRINKPVTMSLDDILSSIHNDCYNRSETYN